MRVLWCKRSENGNPVPLTTGRPKACSWESGKNSNGDETNRAPNTFRVVPLEENIEGSGGLQLHQAGKQEVLNAGTPIPCPPSPPPLCLRSARRLLDLNSQGMDVQSQPDGLTQGFPKTGGLPGSCPFETNQEGVPPKRTDRTRRSLSPKAPKPIWTKTQKRSAFQLLGLPQK